MTLHSISNSGSRSVGTTVFAGVVASIILSVLCFCFKDGILSGIGAVGKIEELSSEYANFIIGGFILFILACVLNPVIRADGSPKYAMLAMAAGAVINIALDPVFIFACNMGMTGAALATFLGQAITFVFYAAYLFKSKTFRLHLKDFIPSGTELISIARLGISSLLTQLAIVIISIVNNVLLMHFSAASGYSAEITQSVITLAFKVFGIVISVVVGIASGGQPVIGYNYGAKKYDRVKSALKIMLIATVAVGAVATLIFELFPKLFIYIFGDGGQGVYHDAYAEFTYLTFRIYLGTILLTCIIKVMAIFFQSIGSPVKATLVTMARDVIFLVPLSIGMAFAGGINLLLWAAPVSDALGLILTTALTVFALKSMKE